MDHSSELLQLARQQVALASNGDLESAIALLPTRQRLLEQTPRTQAADESTVQEILELDRTLSGYIRERMLRLRDESLAIQQGRSALRGYRPLRTPVGLRINTSR